MPALEGRGKGCWLPERRVGSCPGVAKTGRSLKGCVYAGASYTHPRARGSPRCCSAGRKETGEGARRKGGGDQKRGVAGMLPPQRVEACVGISPQLESSPEVGIPESFRLSCQVSFLQHRLNFLPPACGWQRRNGLCLGSEGALLPRVSSRDSFSLDRHPTSE